MQVDKVKHKEEIVITKQQEQQKKLELVTSIIRGDGHTIYEFSLDTHQIHKANFVDDVIEYNGVKQNRRVIIKTNCLYCSALNIKNAKKHFANQLKGIMRNLHKNGVQ